MSVVTFTFEDITNAETWEFPCECRWHDEIGHGPAKWVVRHNGYPCGCKPPGVVLWCDDCLKAVVAHKGSVKCRDCGETFLNDTSHFTVEPIFREAA